MEGQPPTIVQDSEIFRRSRKFRRWDRLYLQHILSFYAQEENKKKVVGYIGYVVQYQYFQEVSERDWKRRSKPM